MDLRQLRNLVLVARYASFGIAAEKLNVTQPALSKSIRALEESLDVRLLDRGPWGLYYLPGLYLGAEHLVVYRSNRRPWTVLAFLVDSVLWRDPT